MTFEQFQAIALIAGGLWGAVLHVRHAKFRIGEESELWFVAGTLLAFFCLPIGLVAACDAF